MRLFLFTTMKKITAILCFAFCLPCLLCSQVKHDYVWPLGYGSVQLWNGFMEGGTLIDFNYSPPKLTLNDFIIDYPFASIADKNGNLVAFTDGCRVSNRNKDLMMNGDTLNPGEVFVKYCSYPWNQFYPAIQPCIFLPKPGSDSLYYLFHLRCDDHSYKPMNLLYSLIDANADNGDGAVISKNNTLLSDSLYLGLYVTAARHANGRDWWVAVTRRFHSEIHVTLVTPDTVQYMGMRDVGFTEIDGGYCCNQTRFSPDGSKFFRNHPGGMLILDFDRCNGTFSNAEYWDYHNMPTGSGGLAISADNRFLYLCTGQKVEQFDLKAPNVLATRETVAQYDSFLSPDPTFFFHAALAPDGKIYILTTSNNDILHVIHNPTRKGPACNVEPHGIKLPGRGSFFEPNFPNYRLGPIDGSPCDTLGIDNLPVAQFRWEVEDTVSQKLIGFTDLSYLEPNTWFWDFGDGTTSQDTSPVHLYALPGIYTVCLTVCNANACDTICQTVDVKTVSTVMLQGEGKHILLWPNPAKDVLYFQSPLRMESLSVLDVRGLEVLQSTVSKEQGFVDIRQLKPGLYFIALQAGGKMWSGKFVKH